MDTSADFGGEIAQETEQLGPGPSAGDAKSARGGSSVGGLTPEDDAATDEMVQQAAAAYSRLLRESDNPPALAEFVADFLAQRGRRVSEQMPPSSRPATADASAQPLSFETGAPTDSSSMAPIANSALCPEMSMDNISMSSNLFQEGSRDDLSSWAEDLSNSLVFGGSSKSTTSVGTPSSAVTSWSQSHSKHTSISSVQSASLSFGHGSAGAIPGAAAFASLGSPTKGQHPTHRLLPLSSLHVEQSDMLMPLRPSSKRNNTASPPSADGAAHEQMQMLHSRIQGDSLMSAWPGQSPIRAEAPSLDGLPSPAASMPPSESMRSRSSTLTSVTSASTHSLPSATHSRNGSIHRVLAHTSTPSPAASASGSTSSARTGLVRPRAEYGDAEYEARKEESKQKRARASQKTQADQAMSFYKLKACLGSRAEGRLIKVQVLETACARIQELEKENINLHTDRRTLMDENAQLKQQVQALQQQLQAANLSTIDRLLQDHNLQQQLPFADSCNH